MASSVLTVEDVCEEYVAASSNPLDAEYLSTLRSQFCPNLTRRAPGSLREAGQICAARPLVATGFPGAPGLRGFSPAAPALALAGAPRTRPWGRALSAERE